MDSRHNYSVLADFDGNVFEDTKDETYPLSQDDRYLDVSGRVFRVKVDVLMKSPKIKAILDKKPWFGTPEQPNIFHSECPIILDTSPMMFEHVLAYLYNPMYLFPEIARDSLIEYGLIFV